MYSSYASSLQRSLSATLAGLIVATLGVIVDQGYLAAAPKGVVEVGQLTPIEAPAQIAALPEVVVTAKRA